MKKRCCSILLVLCLILGMVPAISVPAAAAGTGLLELPKGDGSGQGFIYYNFQETTTFTPGTTYAFLDAVYGQADAVAQLGSGAVLEATSEENNCTKYISRVYNSTEVATYVKVVEPGKGFDFCPFGGLYQVPGTSNPTEYRYFCWAGGAQNCGPLYAYTYQTAEITWANVTVYLNDPGNTNSSNSADYTVKLTYGEGQTVTLDPRSYTVSCSGKTATVTITDNDGNTISGAVTLPCGVVYQPGGLNVTGMPANQGMLSGDSVTAAAGPSREGYAFQHWTDGTQTYDAGASISYKAGGDYTLTAVWKDTQAPQFTCDTVEVTTGTSGEVVQNSIQAALKITDNEPVSECTVTVAATDDTAKTRGDKQVSVTITDKAGNATTKNVTLSVLPGPLTFTEPTYSDGTLSATLLEPGPDNITETGIVWSVMSNPTTTVNNGKYTTSSPVTTPDTSISTPVELAQGVPYYARAYAVADGVTYYGPQTPIGDDIPEYGVFTITNSGSNTFTVSRSGGSGGSDGEQTVYFRTVNGSAVGGLHFTHQNGTLTFAAGETSQTITITEQGVNATYGSNAATGYSNDSRTYSVEIYRVDGGAVIEGNRDVAKRTMTGNTTVDRSNFDEKTDSRPTETKRGDYDVDGNLGWTKNQAGSGQEHINVQPEQAIRPYMQAVSDEIRYYVTFEAKEAESGYQAIQIVPGTSTDTALYPYDDKFEGAFSTATPVGYAALFEHGKSDKNTNYISYHFPAGTFPSESNLTKEVWKGTDTGDYIAFAVDTEQITTSYGACGDKSDAWYTQNVVHHYQFIDTKEPTLLAIGDMGDSTYRVGDSFTVSLIFDEIVDSNNSTLSGKTINTSWGTATYAGGANTNVLYFTGTVPANATNTLTVTSIDASAVIADMADNDMTATVSGDTTATVDTRTPSFTLSAGEISGGVARATISNADENTTSLRYAWSQSSAMPATGWIPLTDTELEQAQTTDFTAMTRQESGTWYLHVLGVCEENGALAYQQTSVDFGAGGGSSGDPELVQPPTITVSVDNTDWATSRTISVTYTNGTAQYRYGEGSWQTITGNSVTVDKNGTYAFRCVSSSKEAVTASATVEKIDTIDPTASIGDITANTPTQKNGVYHSITLPVSYVDAQSGVQTAEYVWSSSASDPGDGWTAVGDAAELTYDASENDETSVYLHLKVIDQVGNAVTVTSPAHSVISEEGAKNYAPTITIGLANKGGEGFTPWDGTSWTNETQTLEWKLEGINDNNYVVTLPDGRTTKDSSGTILVSQNDTYTVSVVDNTYGGSNSNSYTISRIDTTAPTATHDWTDAGWQSGAVTVEFEFNDQGGSGLHTAQYAVVTDNTTPPPPTDLTAFSANTGGSVIVSQDGEWYIYYEVTDGTAGTYGDGTARAANTTSGFVGPIQINATAPTLDISGGMTGGASLELTVTSDGSVEVTHNGATTSVSNSYTVTEAGTYTFTATSNAGMTTQKEVEVCSISFDSGSGSQVGKQLVVKDGKITQPDDPQKTGYTFGGWKNGQMAWDFDDPVTADLTLTAQWTLDTPAVTLTASKTEVTYGEKITLTADANHSGGDDVNLTYAWYKGGTLLSGKTEKTLTLSSVSDSGSYHVVVTAKGGSQTQEATSNTVEVTIDPCPVELRWDYIDPITYDGQQHTVTATITNLVDADVCQLTYQGTRENSSVGNYQVMVTGLGNGNYTLEGAVGATLNWKIIPASGTASVTMEDWIYGDTAKSPTPASDTHGTGNVTYHYTGTTAGGTPYDSDAIPTDAGIYTVTATFAATQNYGEITATDTFTIASCPVKLTWSSETDIPYDGQEHTVSAEITNLLTEDSCELTYADHKKTEVGSYTATVTALSNPNYTLDGAENVTLAWQITSVGGAASVTMAGWIYGDTAKTPVPVSATNGTDNVTYHYAGRNGTSYNSGAVPTNAGDYTVTATFAATANYEEVTATADFSIAPKAIFATWSELTHVYDGTQKAAKASLSGVLSTDDCTLSVSGYQQEEKPVPTPTDAGTYTATAVLTGDDAANYTLKNGTATLTIQPKPVLFTVTGNAVQADGSAKKATVTPDDETCTYTVTYQQNGKEVAAPKEAGSYAIWVKITDANYRHTGGGDTMQVGTLTITQAPPVVYTVSFAGGEGAEGNMSGLEAVGGSVLTLPDCGYDKGGCQFTGWLYNGQTYQPGSSFTMPGGNVTFTAQWQAVFAVSGTITEKTEGEDATVANAVVSLWLGANKINETTTDNDGRYTFDKLLPGIYNLVVTKDVRTVTSKVEIKDKDTACDATLPKGATNSIVDVAPGSPDIVVGKLDTMFENTDGTVYTAEDQKTVQQGGKVEITFTAEVKEETDVTSDLKKIQAVSGSSNLALTMDYALTKTVTPSSGGEGTLEPIHESSVLLEVLLPLPTELQGKASYSVYRVHDGAAQELKQGKGSKNELGEYFTVNSDKTGMTLYVKCFSTYAIGYTESSGSGGGGSGSGGGGAVPTYPPKVEQPEHGSVTVSPSSPQKGDTVTITPVPEDGYVVDQVLVTGPNGQPVEVPPNGDGSYTFTQPAGTVTITVTFRPRNGISDCPRDESCPMAPFTDADPLAWYHDGVHYCVEKGLMVGTGESTFSPNIATTRAMIVTILWRLEGSPVVSDAIDYDDVKPEDWYGEAVRWADSAGVVTGYSPEKFGPNNPITREQMAAMLWRYVGSPQAAGSLTAFVDGEQTSDWAQPAMCWAVDQGLIDGVGDDRLVPRGQATRAQAATILMRFAQTAATF